MFFVTASLCSTLLFLGFFVFVSAGADVSSCSVANIQIFGLQQTYTPVPLVNLGCGSGDQKNITAESGQDVSLPCRAPNNKIIVLEWRRAEYGANYVFLYRDGRFDPANQHPSFKNRVDLQDRQMKDGDVSLILKDVTINDAGTYKCRVFMRETRLWQLIHLHVVPPGPKTITAESGQDVTLTCRAPNNKIKVVEWSRDDLGDKNVLFYEDGQFVPDNQHPSFNNRVDLQDKQMKDGEGSLILNNVNTADTGTYKCHVLMRETRLWQLSLIYLTVFDPPDQKKITAEPGQDVTLTCRAPNNNIIVLKWSRADLGDEYVLFYQKGQFVPDNQHPSLKNRVDLQDRQMKDGDVSLILKNVTIDDAGTYECYVVQQKEGPMTLINNIYLNVVDPPGQTGEHTEDVKWIVGLLVTAGILLGVAFVIHKTCGIQNVVALFWNFVLHGRWLVHTDDNE